ncbi:hypothetical protein HAX54_033328 [Datura stramonium]|uniref:NB-ARC domain-containing protein n=1 Tax=Datura stramonium TaxID=4076 RepID=A0ABS8SD88_DATST|nr:hypothetical protein [Datura stramonium]
MAEVAEIQEKNASDIVSDHTKDATNAHTSSQFSRNPGMNEEMVGLKDVMDELRGILTKGLVINHSGDLIGGTDRFDEEADDVLADKLCQQLFGTRYLILIDDIWETSAWDDLKLWFHDANNGSRIILTTRHYDVASHAKHDTDPLDVGKRIAQKCGGLPLSIVLVAGTLGRLEKKKHCWEQVAADLGPHIHAQSEDTWLWISEGFVKSQMEKLLEDIAKEYLENLADRNLVVVAKKSVDGKIKACRIHHLLLEFCREKAKSGNFLEMIKW